MTTSGKYFVGQELVITDGRGDRGRTDILTVSRVGRSYFYVKQYSQERKFSLSDGIEDCGQYTGGEAFTHEEWDYNEARLLLWNRLNFLGVVRSYHSDALSKATNEQLQAIIDILAV